MQLGMAIRKAREKKSIGRGVAAKQAGIPEDTWKKIEIGKTHVSLRMLEKIARSLELRPSDLLKLSEDTNDSEQDTDIRQSLAGLGEKERNQQPKPIEIRHLRAGEAEPSPEFHIWQGDLAYAKGLWGKALEAYERAEQLMLRRDQAWARLVLERLGQTLINLNAFSQMDQKITLVEERYQQVFRERFRQDDPVIQMLIEEKRAWKETWMGNAHLAEGHAQEAHRLARLLGDETTVEATGLHFAGRAICETVTTYMLYPQLFPSVKMDTTIYNRLQKAELFLSLSERVEKREESIGFNTQWIARALRAQGKLFDARQKDRLWRQIFGREEASAEAKLDLVKLILLEDSDLYTARIDAQDILHQITESFKTWQYAPGLAEAAITQAYIKLLEHQYYTPIDRQEGVDLCLVALHLHPFPNHPLHKVAVRLLSVFALSMNQLEYASYEENLQSRLLGRDKSFGLLDFAFVSWENSTGESGHERLLHKLRFHKHYADSHK